MCETHRPYSMLFSFTNQVSLLQEHGRSQLVISTLRFPCES